MMSRAGFCWGWELLASFWHHMNNEDVSKIQSKLDIVKSAGRAFFFTITISKIHCIEIFQYSKVYTNAVFVPEKFFTIVRSSLYRGFTISSFDRTNKMSLCIARHINKRVTFKRVLSNYLYVKSATVYSINQSAKSKSRLTLNNPILCP